MVGFVVTDGAHSLSPRRAANNAIRAGQNGRNLRRFAGPEGLDRLLLVLAAMVFEKVGMDLVRQRSVSTACQMVRFHARPAAARLQHKRPDAAPLQRVTVLTGTTWLTGRAGPGEE